MELRDFWAKTIPFQSVLTHARVSGVVAQTLLKYWMSSGDCTQLSEGLGLAETDLSRFVGYLVSLHDVGKLEYSFQAKDDVFRKRLSADPELAGIYDESVRHEKTGCDSLHTLWKKAGEDRASARLMAKIVGAHHQGKTGNGHFLRSSPWYGLQKELELSMRSYFLGKVEKALPVIDREKQGMTAALLLGLMILSDWISSSGVYSDAEDWIHDTDAAARIRAGTMDFLSRSELMPHPVKWPETFCGIWPNISQEGRRPLQKDIEALLSEIPNAHFILIEAPMGEGKTEAGVYAALQMARRWGKDGLYVALPTAATANQMVGRIRSLLDMHGLETSVRLLHAMAWLEQPEEQHATEEKDAISAWLAPVRRGLLGQYAVGTVDQAMLAATNVKYGVLRLMGLSNKALVMDEIHSYDAYMSEIIGRLLEWCRALEIPVVMLSATLPPEQKGKLLAAYTSQPLPGDYPLITVIDSNGAVMERRIGQTSHRLAVSVSLSDSLGDAERIAALAIAQTETGGCLCVLMNTVRESQAVYSAIRRQYDGDLLLFHAQFPAAQRVELEEVCIRRYGKDKSHRPKRSILVATQVAEQSLDVDFDRMLTAIAPVDLLLQRMGRVFRHDDTPRPPGCSGAVVTVLVPAASGSFGPSAYVYPDCLLRSAIRVLENKPRIRIPEDLAPLVRAGYDPSLAPEEEVRRWQEKLVRDQVEAGASQQYLLRAPNKVYSALDELVPFADDAETYQLAAKTRLGEPTVRIALLPPREMERLGPFLRTENGRRIAAVGDRKLAEDVMRLSVSVRIARIGGNPSGFSDIYGAKLLTGLRILPTEDGCYRTDNGKTIRFDPELGLLIEDGEV